MEKPAKKLLLLELQSLLAAQFSVKYVMTEIV